jgi:hypothetical protein
MTMALVREYDVLPGVAGEFDLNRTASLAELDAWLWDLRGG